MSSGTFSYPLGFAAVLAVIGLVVSSTTREGEKLRVPKAAASGEIRDLHCGPDDSFKERCEEFMKKYPNADEAMAVGLVCGDKLVQAGRWKEVGDWFHDLAVRFPDSEHMDRYLYFQGVALFQQADFDAACVMFETMTKDHPGSALLESALYYDAMAKFLDCDYESFLKASGAFLKRFPEGRFAGDIQHRISFIDSNDTKSDKSAKIIDDLGYFLLRYPDDPARGSMLCLLADTYKKKGDSDKALDSYKKAVWTDSPDDVIQYALDSATGIMQGNKDWKGIAKLHRDFIIRNPKSQLLAVSVRWLVQAERREGEAGEAGDALAVVLKAGMSDPSNEHVEAVIEELVKSMVPRKRAQDLDADALDQQLVELLEKAAGPNANTTAKARIYYARSQLARLLKRNDRSELYLKGIALSNLKDPSVLSPRLLSTSGDTLLKSGDVDGAERMYQWLRDHHAAKFGNVASIGLGNVALARKKPEEALKLFNGVLENQPAPPEITGATVGKLQALVDLNKDDEAMKLALEAVANRTFKGESTARIYLKLGGLYEKKAAAAASEEAAGFLKQAHGIYQRVYVAYQGFPELCAEGYLRAAGVLKKLGDEKRARETLKALIEHPKLQNTEAAKKAKAMLEAEGK